MSGPRRQPQQTLLFDLELDEPPSLDAGLEPGPHRSDGAADAAPNAATDLPVTAMAPVRPRLLAGAVDLGCHLAVAGAGAVGAVLLGVRPEPAALPGLGLLVVVFSLFFLVVPLAFWGRTAGMAAAGISCRAADDQPLTFGEASRRWAGSLLTVAACGVPALLVLAGGRSLADRLSGSVVVQE